MAMLNGKQNCAENLSSFAFGACVRLIIQAIHR